MSDEQTRKNTSDAGQSREDRLKAALKANLMRRKAQSRGRAQKVEPQDGTDTTKPGRTGQDKDA